MQTQFRHRSIEETAVGGHYTAAARWGFIVCASASLLLGGIGAEGRLGHYDAANMVYLPLPPGVRSSDLEHGGALAQEQRFLIDSAPIRMRLTRTTVTLTMCTMRV